MGTVFAYTAARLGLFLATAGVLFLFGARGMLLLALAILISGLISFVLLSRQRDKMSDSVAAGVRSRRRKFREGVTKEDA